MGTALCTPSPGRRILIVDDEPELVRALALRLNSAGYETVSASDEALERSFPH